MKRTVICVVALASLLLAAAAFASIRRFTGSVREGGTVSFEVSKELIHKQVTLYGSWVTSLLHMEELVERLDRWGLHPETTCTDRLPLSQAPEAYRRAADGQTGKVCIVFDA